ncbi:general transcription factor II-I repeat domain-containing protein 2A [Trichonephila clavipes]|nr:general transcription factor II-I repeat domain-containing protein 2A [Trichonephila clavipes]
MQLIDFQSSLITIQKFIGAKEELELIKTERLTNHIIKNVSNELLETWNSIPDTFNCLKKLVHAILTLLSSTYACESLFSEMNNIKDSLRNRLADDSNSVCTLLKNLGGRTGKILRPSSVALKSKNQEINRLQLAVKLPWAIFFESVDILS